MYKGWIGGRGLSECLEEGGQPEAPPLGLFGVAMSPRSHYHWGKFETHAFHVVPSMGPVVSVTNLHGWQNLL